MQQQSKRLEALRSSVQAGVAQESSLCARHREDLELRVWAVAEGMEKLASPDPRKDLAGKVEAALQESEGLLRDLQAGRDSLANRRGMVVRAIRVAGQDHPQPYAIYVPAGYDAGRGWPLFIYLHGGGKIEQAIFALDRLAPASPPASQPTTQPAGPIDQMLKIWIPRRGDGWTDPVNDESVLGAIADVQANYNVDVDRIYVQGFSLGGFATMHYAVRLPDVFAGAGPSGMTADYDVLPFAENLTNVPTYICHGSQDDVCDVRNSLRVFDRLKTLRLDAVFREEALVQHASTDLARAGQEAWLLAKTRKAWPDRVVYVTDRPRYHKAYWIDIVRTGPLSEHALARIEAVRSGPGQFTVRTERVQAFAILLNEAIGPVGKPVTVAVNGQEARTYPWPADGRLVVEVAQPVE